MESWRSTGTCCEAVFPALSVIIYLDPQVLCLFDVAGAVDRSVIDGSDAFIADYQGAGIRQPGRSAVGRELGSGYA
jgi:hypothetical protein